MFQDIEIPSDRRSPCGLMGKVLSTQNDSSLSETSLMYQSHAPELNQDRIIRMFKFIRGKATTERAGQTPVGRSRARFLPQV